MTHTKNRCLKSTLAIAIASTFCNPGFAQDTPTDDMEVIAVTGIRQSLTEAMGIKKESSTVVDAISAEDVGKFPDINVAESLQRITGVQINRSRGEGSSINIRGLPSDFVLVRMNNVALPNALTDTGSDTSRSFDFTSLPSEFVRTLEVHKTPTASLEEGGLAGSVVIRTPRPFDFTERQLALSVQGSKESNAEDIGPRVTAFYSDVYGDGDFGLTLGVSYMERNSGTQDFLNFGYTSFSEAEGFTSGSQQFGAFTEDGIANPEICDGSVASRDLCSGQDFNGNGVLDDGSVAIPYITFHTMYDEKRTRTSAILSAQWAASDNLELTADGFYTKYEVDSARAEFLAFPYNSLGPYYPDESEIRDIDGRAVATTFRADTVDTRAGNRIEQREGDTWSMTLLGKYLTDNWTVNGQVNRSRSSQLADNLNIVNSTLVDLTLQSEQGDAVTSTTYMNGSEDRVLDPQNYRLVGVNGAYNQASSEDLLDIKLDAERYLDFGNITKFKTGFHYADRNKVGQSARLTMNVAQIESLFGDQPPVELFEQLGITGTSSAAFLLQPVSPLNGAYLENYPGLIQERLAIDTRRMLNSFSREELIAAGNYGIDPTLSEDVSEEATNAYAEIAFESGDGNLSGNFGVRFTRTEQLSRGAGADLNQITFNPNGGLTTVAPLGLIEESNSYSEWLPSLNLRYNLTDELIARFGASRTIARPRFTDISPVTVANVEANSITGGNPTLDPFKSNNIDVALEYYYGDTDMVSATLFYKDLVSLIRSGSTVINLPVTNALTGEVFTAQFIDRSPSNGEGAKIRGAELAGQHSFVSLPGLLANTGVNANYTFIDNSDPEAITAGSKHNFNVGGFYEDDTFGARISYTWRDKFLSQLVAFGGRGAVTQAYGTLDASVNYNVSENFTVVVEGVNLLDEAVEIKFTDGLPYQVVDNGRRLFAGFRATF